MILGLDIGGANLKAADTGERAHSVPFPLWKNPAGLADTLRGLIGRFDPPDRLAVTMTGELCDCFETKAEGVAHILDAVETIAGPTPIDVWQTAGEFVPPGVARDAWQLTAAANWHATATFVGRVVPEGTALLVDMGSTTTDLIPLQDGMPVPTGLTDPERLRSGELLYRGATRTPLCVMQSLPTREGESTDDWGIPAAEFFATSKDAYIVTDVLPEGPNDRETADGRPATSEHCLSRLARMICADRSEASDENLWNLAWAYQYETERLLFESVRAARGRLGGTIDRLLIAGSGAAVLRAWLADPPPEEFEGIEQLDLASLFTPRISDCAAAYAAARLCEERCA